MILCVMQGVFVKAERRAAGVEASAKDSPRATAAHIKASTFSLVVSPFLSSLFYSNDSAVAERHIMAKLVMMGSRRDYSPTRLISTAQNEAHVLSVFISLSLSLLQF